MSETATPGADLPARTARRTDTALAVPQADPTDASRLLASLAGHLTLSRELEAARARLRESEERFRCLASVVPDAIIVADMDGVVRFVNPAAERLLGRPAAQIVGEPFAHPLVQDTTTEVQIVTPAGERRTAQMHVVPTAWAGRPAVLAWMRDMTDAIAAQRRREQINQRLYQAQKLEALGTLASGVAHDFNNVLTSISGCAELALRYADPSSMVHRLVQEIPRHARRAAELISSLLTFGRCNEMRRQPTALVPIVKEAVKMLRRTLPESIAVVPQWPPQLPPVMADATQVQQVVLNLCVNARDAMPEGGQITIAVDERQTTSPIPATDGDVPPGHWVVLSVADTGTGMTPEVRDRVFEPFFTTKPQGQGTGLGLATCYGIVRSHEGHIELQTAPGEGTTVRVWLPAVQVPAANEEVTAVDSLPGGSETLLVVEDDPSVLGVAVAMLEALGYRVLSASNGHEAIETYERHRNDIALVLTDLIMPGMGGAKLTDALASANGSLRVLLITGYDMDDGDPALNHPAVRGWVRKPFSQCELAKAIRRALDGVDVAAEAPLASETPLPRRAQPASSSRPLARAHSAS